MLPRVLAATAAANTEIDQELVAIVLRIGFTHSLVVVLQEMGRNACKAGMLGNFVVFSD